MQLLEKPKNPWSIPFILLGVARAHIEQEAGFINISERQTRPRSNQDSKREPSCFPLLWNVFFPLLLLHYFFFYSPFIICPLLHHSQHTASISRANNPPSSLSTLLTTCNTHTHTHPHTHKNTHTLERRGLWPLGLSYPSQPLDRHTMLTLAGSLGSATGNKRTNNSRPSASDTHNQINSDKNRGGDAGQRKWVCCWSH